MLSPCLVIGSVYLFSSRLASQLPDDPLGCLIDRNLSIWMKRLPKEYHEAVEAKEQGRRRFNSPVCSLMLYLDAQMDVTLMILLTPTHKINERRECQHRVSPDFRLRSRESRAGR